MNKDFIRVRNMEINAAKEITRQCDADALAIVLNDPEVMGSDVMGKQRIGKDSGCLEQTVAGGLWGLQQRP